MEKKLYKLDSRKEKEKEEFAKSLRKDADFLSAGLNILVCFLICGGIGYYADFRLGTEKWTAVGALAGIAIGFVHFVKFIIDAIKKK